LLNFHAPARQPALFFFSLSRRYVLLMRFANLSLRHVEKTHYFASGLDSFRVWLIAVECPTVPHINHVGARKLQVTESEFGHLEDTLRQHDDSAVRVAGLRYLCANLFDHYGKQTGVDLSPFKATLNACIGAFVREREMSASAVRTADAAVARAGETVAYLQGLPG
jgi:hypothetical protein